MGIVPLILHRMKMMGTLFILFFFLQISHVFPESVLILGGEVEDVLHPALAEVESYGSCGLFESGVPELPKNLRETGAVVYGNKIVLCGGYKLVGTSIKECISLDLDASPRVWKEFPALKHARHYHAMVVVGGDLYAVGGDNFIGAIRSIERFNPESNSWEEFGSMNGYRLHFCALPWDQDGIVVIGGFDDENHEARTELYNVTTKSWSMLANLNIERGLHACAWHQGKIIAAGGWVNDNDPFLPGQESSASVEVYDPEKNTWTEGVSMTTKRTSFGLASINGVLTAIGGWEFPHYVDTVEGFNEEKQEWTNDDGLLAKKKAGFSVVDTADRFKDIECL